MYRGHITNVKQKGGKGNWHLQKLLSASATEDIQATLIKFSVLPTYEKLLRELVMRLSETYRKYRRTTSQDRKKQKGGTLFLCGNCDIVPVQSQGMAPLADSARTKKKCFQKKSHTEKERKMNAFDNHFREYEKASRVLFQ